VTELDKVALWAGLISSIVSIVLSVVAIVAAILGNWRLEKVSDATIRSLQKIESDVARVSDETSGLLKAGWEKMLLNLGGTPAVPMVGNSAAGAKEVAAGLMDEIRSAVAELKPQEDEETPQRIKALDEALKDVKRTLAAQLSSEDSVPSRHVRPLEQRLAIMPALARELAYEIRNRHLTHDQYQKLRSGPLRSAVVALRSRGILTPLSSKEEAPQPVYWFPPERSEGLVSASVLSRPGVREIEELVRTELARVGYVPKQPNGPSF